MSSCVTSVIAPGILSIAFGLRVPVTTMRWPSSSWGGWLRQRRQGHDADQGQRQRQSGGGEGRRCLSHVLLS
jgi:hypothetical protein